MKDGIDMNVKCVKENVDDHMGLRVNLYDLRHVYMCMCTW